MFTKILKVFAVVSLVGLSYFLVIIVMPLLSTFAISANNTIATNSLAGGGNMTADYPGLSGGLLGAPLFLYFVPAIFGIAWVVFILREPISARLSNIRGGGGSNW